MPKHAAIRGAKPLITPKDRHHQLINRAPAPSWITGWRDRIKVTKLIDRLQAFALDDPEAPTGPRLTRTQATVALALLGKVLPNVQHVEVGGTDKPITVQVLRFTDPQDDAVVSGPDSAANGADKGANGGGAAPMLNGPGEPLTIDITPRLIEDEPRPKRRSRSAS